MNHLVESWTPVSDRILMLKLSTKPMPTSIIQIYAPTSDHSDTDCNTFYNQLQEVSDINKSFERTIAMGDFNAKLGTGQEQGEFTNYIKYLVRAPNLAFWIKHAVQCWTDVGK